MNQLQTAMNSLFRGLDNGARRSQRSSDLRGKTYPQINLSEDVDHLYFEAFIPGVDEKTLDLSLTGNSLTLSGERHSEQSLNEGNIIHRRERVTGKFLRTVELPIDIDVKAVSAEYRDGVLRVTLGKAAKAKSQKISIASH
jgi:HSP20 family protein